jgi:hypothetical protein
VPIKFPFDYTHYLMLLALPIHPPVIPHTAPNPTTHPHLSHPPHIAPPTCQMYKQHQRHGSARPIWAFAGRHFTWLFEAIQQRFRHVSGSLGAQTTRFFHSVVTVELFFWRRCTKQQPNQAHGRGCVEAAAQTFHKQSYTGSSGSTKRPESPAFEAEAVAALQRCCRKCAIVLQSITARAAASDIPRSRLAKAG